MKKKLRVSKFRSKIFEIFSFEFSSSTDYVIKCKMISKKGLKLDFTIQRRREEKERREIVDGGEVEETERGWIVMVEEGWIYERKGSSPRTIRNIFRENFLLAKPYGPYGVRFQNTRPAPIREKRILSFSLSPLCLSLVSFCFSIVCPKKEEGFYMYTFFLFA